MKTDEVITEKLTKISSKDVERNECHSQQFVEMAEEERREEELRITLER